VRRHEDLLIALFVLEQQMAEGKAPVFEHESEQFANALV
jgi:hypothetical protein